MSAAITEQHFGLILSLPTLSRHSDLPTVTLSFSQLLYHISIDSLRIHREIYRSYEGLVEDSELDYNLLPESTPTTGDATASSGSSSTIRASASSFISTPEQSLLPVQASTLKHVSLGIKCGTEAGDAANQAWPIRFGIAFAFLICATFQTTTVAAAQQYIWMTPDAEISRTESSNRLYSLTSDTRSIFNLELFKATRVSLLLGIIFWCLEFIGVAPLATLSVIPRNVSVLAYIPILDPSQPSLQNSLRSGSTICSSIHQYRAWTGHTSSTFTALQCYVFKRTVRSNSVPTKSLIHFKTFNPYMSTVASTTHTGILITTGFSFPPGRGITPQAPGAKVVPEIIAHPFNI
ncbi:hypothetical protein BDZ45DRAFT_751804 [Acephala macrosclerotiorum]|nr:hypothetical protein BDZ45DRAFT_751804 [Acephala macrosclerotiorum]